MYISKQDAEKARASRGFSSFQDWSRQNLEGQSRLKQRAKEEGADKTLVNQMIKALERERLSMIAQNL